MKINKLLVALTALVPGLTFATVSITGTALNGGTTGIAVGQEGVVLVDLDGSPFTAAALTDLASGLNISDSASYDGFSVIYSGLVTDFFGTAIFDVAAGAVDLSNGIDAGDSFGILIFGASSGTTSAGDSYGIFTDGSWVLPNDGSGVTFGSELTQVASAPGLSSTVVPEPSTFAALAGFLALGCVALRRRG
jgi:hypothetical protein